MAWKPWYEKVVDIDGQAERDEFIRGVFATPGQVSGPKRAADVLTSLVLGWGISQVTKKRP